MPAYVPDLRPALARYGPVELADLFDAFDLTVTYDKPSHGLELAATVTAELVSAPRSPATTSPAVAGF